MFRRLQLLKGVVNRLGKSPAVKVGVDEAVVLIGRRGSASFGVGAPQGAEPEKGVDGAFGDEPGAGFRGVDAPDMWEDRVRRATA